MCLEIESLHTSQVAHQDGAYPGFCGMKRLGVFLLPPEWDASPSQGHPFIRLGRERHCESKAPAKRSQHANTTCRNIVGRNMLRAFGHRVATCWLLLAQV